MQDPDLEPEEDDEDDGGDLRRRGFLERHDWIPWIAAAAVIGGVAGFILGYAE